jgi:uncharacterized protein
MKSKEMIKDSNLHSLLSEIKDGLEQIYGDKLKSIILYGSYARAQEADGSDLDLMALLDLSDEDIESKNEEVLELTVNLTTRYGVLVSIVKNNIDFFNEWVDTLPYFRNVMADGIDIYG